ncbi:MAG: peptide chain release factor N(5)-glutamine methyltransferase [Actinobacteria bacterium]|nr:peptide chain release factor N(5)-glutamine methyltransferase [Actinomycetota bacterium]
MNAESQTVRQLLAWAVDRLAEHVASPQVDAERIFMHVLGVKRSDLYVDERVASRGEEDLLRLLIERRRTLEPLQYLTGTQGFRSIELLVGPGVLVPRPETEVLVGRVIEKTSGIPRPKIVEVGTGSGAIALALGGELLQANVWATEISSDAMAWATKNLERLQLPNVELMEGDLFSPLPSDLRGKLDVVVSNPPYLSDSDLARAPIDVRDHEPRIATTAGPSGLEVATRVIHEARQWLRPGGWLLLETWAGQWSSLKILLEENYEVVSIHPDLGGTDRVAEARWPGSGR